ncbi:MAG: hypothetical protein HC933_06365 [Pleurocapsa sp. SU_196_0]|nr:hypothetical protein [Pleurocapsa sp. SU_196_0]
MVNQPPPEVTAAMQELVTVLTAIGTVYADQHGSITCPRCTGELKWAASSRRLYVKCVTADCVRFEIAGTYRKERKTPVYRQEKLL